MRRLVTTFTLALIGTTVGVQEGLKPFTVEALFEDKTLELIGNFAAADKGFPLVVDPRSPHGVLKSHIGYHFRRLKMDFFGRYLHYDLGGI